MDTQAVESVIQALQAGLRGGPAAPVRDVIATIQGTVTLSYQLVFPVRLYRPGTSYSKGVNVAFQEDTGAYTPALTAAVAKELGLAEGQSLTIQGATGSGSAYQTAVGIDLAAFSSHPSTAQLFPSVPCIVDPELEGYPLLGASFFRDHGLGLDINWRTGAVVIYRG